MDHRVARFLNEDGKLKQLPAKQAMKDLVFAYLAEKFDADARYTEPEVNGILGSWHTFGDYFVLRRGMVDSGFLCRLTDGSQYWLNKQKPADADEA